MIDTLDLRRSSARLYVERTSEELLDCLAEYGTNRGRLLNASTAFGPLLYVLAEAHYKSRQPRTLARKGQDERDGRAMKTSKPANRQLGEDRVQRAYAASWYSLAYLYAKKGTRGDVRENNRWAP